MKKFLNRWDRLSFRLPLLIVLAAIATGSVTLWLAVSGASDTFITQRKERMELVRNERERAIQSMFKNVRNDLGVLAVRASTVRDLRELSADLRSLSEEKRKALIAAFVDNNPYPTGSREALDDPGDGSAYAKHHKEVHNFYRQYIQIQGYYDIYLVDAYGNVVYNVSKESDFGTNLLSGPYHEDAAAEVFRKAVTAVPPWDAVFADMKMYPPSNGPALFMGQAVRDSDGTVIGAILLQMNVAELKATANHIQDLGESGEVYLVGPDQILRSETRFMKDVLLKRKMETEGARRSAAGFEGSSVNKDYLGNEVIAAYGPIDIMGVRWGIVSKVDLAEVLGPLRNLTQRTIVGTLLATTLIALFGYFLARRISRPLERALYAMNRLSQGQLNFDIDIGGGAAETRQIADALKVFQANLIETDNLVKTVKQTQAQTAAILDNSPIGVIVLGLNDEVLFVNDPGASVLGRQPDLMVGQPFSFDDMAMLSSSWAALVSAVRKNGQVRDADFDLRVHEKGVVSLVLTVQKTTFSGKEGYLVWFQDVTAQKQAREELRALSTRFVAFLESTPDLVSIKDTEGRYQAASQSLATFAGVRSWRDFLGKKSQDMFPPEIGRARDALDVEIL
ncbi:MAG: PAS domain S-box protein, partial [Candidatus Binataceae bacterium]